ncbi:MAG: hypothetical protein GF313_04805 [Caldithrix sp.]|nr:hypothetical protein [Caldithrix sp.]
MKTCKYSLLVYVLVLLTACASTRTNVSLVQPLRNHLKTGNYAKAITQIDKARQNKAYTKKDRVLYYLNKGSILHYQGQYAKSNELFEQAELAMEELFTKSVSKAAASLLLNDNALPYYGEVYENIYVNIFKAVNYLNLNRFDDAYVEVRRIDIKLRELQDKYERMAREMNTAEDAKIKIDPGTIKFTDDVLAHYISHLIYRAEGAYDDSRIALTNLNEAWNTYSNIYDYAMPDFIRKNIKWAQLGDASGSSTRRGEKTKMNIIAFTGKAPSKKAVGGKITTYDDAIGISSLEMPIATPNIPFPGMKKGYHFKFSMPVIKEGHSNINQIDVFMNSKKLGKLYLLEDMGKVAKHTFETKKNIIYFKTIIRTVVKGLAAAEAKKKLRKETGANAFLGAIMDAAVDMGVDATENADLRCWQTMPQHCYVGEFDVPPGTHHITIKFINRNGLIVKTKEVPNFKVDAGLNLIDAVSLN